jgi:hypothetical protein
VTFGRELNASDDRGFFEAATPLSAGRRVVEGKQIEPFRVGLARCRLALKPGIDVRAPRRARLAYRDVASASNRLTLIAAIVPASAVTTHTLFCLRTPLALPQQQVLCGLLNSYVANYLIRLRVNTHVTVSLVSRLQVPVVKTGQADFGRLHALADALAKGSRAAEETAEYVELQAVVARLYGLSTDDFAHVLDTFPLVPGAVRTAALDRLRDIAAGAG